MTHPSIPKPVSHIVIDFERRQHIQMNFDDIGFRQRKNQIHQANTKNAL